ncbi:MAG: hypothetical protein CVU03_10945 [Bacteroidetes bacterium HGW-Bacteroidetes-2]|nr:MAG: hypothetical protein CVU03_10945 [Bacteroidetes bacterium HGW-Bacteroidetes-2]
MVNKVNISGFHSFFYILFKLGKSLPTKIVFAVINKIIRNHQIRIGVEIVKTRKANAGIKEGVCFKIR